MKKTSYSIIFLLICSSCSYFRVIPQNDYTAESIMQYDTSGKYIILHSGEVAWHIYNLEVKDDSIHAILYFDLGYHMKYLDAKEKGLNKFNRKWEPRVIKSIHIYADSNVIRSNAPFIRIPLSSIYAVKSYEYARAPSRASVIVPLVFASIPVAMLITVAILASMSKFP